MSRIESFDRKMYEGKEIPEDEKEEIPSKEGSHACTPNTANLRHYG